MPNRGRMRDRRPPHVFQHMARHKNQILAIKGN